MSSLGRKWMSVCLVFAAGCATRGNVDMLESELRQHEEARIELENKVGRLETDLRVARSDADSLRTRLAKAGDKPPPVEHANAVFRVTELKFQNLMTGGWDRDPAPGDEGVSVVLTPLDEHGDLVKLPGDTEIELLDLSHTGDDQRLGLWRFSADQLADSWHKGVIGSGFLLRLPWQKVPTNDKLTLVARLKNADGRKFDATTQLTVSPPAESSMVAERTVDIPPSKYRIKAEPISAPRRLPRVVKEAMPEDTPITKPKLPPVPPEANNDELEFESTSPDETTGQDEVEGDLEDEAPAAIPTDDDRPVVEESDRWTLNDVPVLR